ncbi:MAG: type I DNA topoisomerase, partial [Patescibacteria group bacterium]
KTIEKYLAHEYKVVASVGHIRDLPKNNKKAIDIEAGFVPHYEISAGKEKVVSELKSLAKKSTEVLLATDPDREGEAIAWHVAETCGLKKPKRVLFYEITPNAVKEAVAHPRELDQNLRIAQEARRVLDRLVGYDLSGLIWKKVRYGLSAGRVQSPALHILVEREKEIRAFVPEKYFVLKATLATVAKDVLELTCSEEPREETRANDIVTRGKAGTWNITSIKETEVAKRPKAPFTTSTLQQAASSRLGFSPSRAMRIAQKLYEKGFITYMRTDSTSLSKEAQASILSAIEKEFGKNYVERREYKTKSKNAQEAHEAIRPTDAGKKTAGVTEEEKRLYNLIRVRTLASQMVDAKVLRTKITANIGETDFPDFSVTGSHLLFPGWLALDTVARSEDVELPKLTSGAALKLLELNSEAKETLPPNRYSEAGLVKELEKRGIGRPSTYASIIKTIIDRGYVIKDGKALQPTETGEVVDNFLSEHFHDFVSDTFTADMENKLDEIAEGKRDYVKTLKDFYTPFTKEVKAKDKLEKMTNLGDAPEGILCPVCQGNMIIKLARSGKFLSCAKFPECTGARTIDGEELEGPKEIGEDCPDCKDGKLVERDGRYGRFVSCNNYPKCKYIKRDAGSQPTTGIKCPMCKDGEMAERRGRFGIFYSCTNYPECKNAIKTKPTGNICDYILEDKDKKLCGALMMEGTKTIPERCSDKTCPNHRPDKVQKS